MRRKPIYILPSASASMVSRYADGYKACAEAGYAAALRDAVAAIYRTCGHTKYEGCSPCPHDEAVTAIKALRKEQK